ARHPAGRELLLADIRHYQCRPRDAPAGEADAPPAALALYLEQVVLRGGLGGASRLACGCNSHHRHGAFSIGDPVRGREVRVAVQDELRALLADDLLKPGDAE